MYVRGFGHGHIVEHCLSCVPTQETSPPSSGRWMHSWITTGMDLVLVLLTHLLVVTLLVILAGHVGKSKSASGRRRRQRHCCTLHRRPRGVDRPRAQAEAAAPTSEVQEEQRHGSLVGIITAMFYYTGLKRVKFQYREGSMQCALMIVLPLFINM